MSKPFTILRLDKEYEFRLTNKAAYIYEEVTGKSFMNLGDDFGIKDINALVYAGLKCIDKDMTLDRTIDLIDEHIDIEELTKIIEKATNQSTFFKMANNQK